MYNVDYDSLRYPRQPCEDIFFPRNRYDKPAWAGTRCFGERERIGSSAIGRGVYGWYNGFYLCTSKKKKKKKSAVEQQVYVLARIYIRPKQKSLFTALYDRSSARLYLLKYVHRKKKEMVVKRQKKNGSAFSTVESTRKHTYRLQTTCMMHEMQPEYEQSIIKKKRCICIVLIYCFFIHSFILSFGII